MKTKIVLMALLLGSASAFGLDYTTDGEVIRSDISDSWVKIGVNPQTATPPYPTVNVYVDRGVSITASSYLMIYDNNSITFSGGNTVYGGTVSVRKNSALYAEDTTFNINEITFMDGGSNSVLKNCTLNLKEFTIMTEDSGSLVLDNTKITAGDWFGGTQLHDGLFNITLKNGSTLNIIDAPSYGFNGGANFHLEGGSSLTANSSIASGSDIFVAAVARSILTASLKLQKQSPLLPTRKSTQAQFLSKSSKCRSRKTSSRAATKTSILPTSSAKMRALFSPRLKAARSLRLLTQTGTNTRRNSTRQAEA